MKSFYVYVSSDASSNLEVGMTTDLLAPRPVGRIEEPGHRDPGGDDGKLLYFECFRNEENARVRQRDIGMWQPEKLLELVEFVNPEWYDLASIPEDLQATLDRHEKNIID